jgi:hypothetical protein
MYRDRQTENRTEWAEDIRKEELIIEADEILAQKQSPPEVCQMSMRLWHAKSSALFLRMLHWLSYKVNKIIDTIDPKSPIRHAPGKGTGNTDQRAL